MSRNDEKGGADSKVARFAEAKPKDNEPRIINLMDALKQSIEEARKKREEKP